MLCGVVRLNEDECPLAGACAGGQLEEERRLAYVAMSRAKERLFLSCIAMDGAGQPCSPSRFLGEIPRHLVRREAHFD